MENWRDIAHDNYAAAGALLRAGRWRSAISRAYYAAYARVVAALMRYNVAMPLGQEGPSHRKLPGLVERHMANLSARDRWRLFSRIVGLYAMRVNADYHPSVSVDVRDARNVMGMLSDVFRWTKEAM